MYSAGSRITGKAQDSQSSPRGRAMFGKSERNKEVRNIPSYSYTVFGQQSYTLINAISGDGLALFGNFMTLIGDI